MKRAIILACTLLLGAAAHAKIEWRHNIPESVCQEDNSIYHVTVDAGIIALTDATLSLTKYTGLETEAMRPEDYWHSVPARIGGTNERFEFNFRWLSPGDYKLYMTATKSGLWDNRSSLTVEFTVHSNGSEGIRIEGVEQQEGRYIICPENDYVFTLPGIDHAQLEWSVLEGDSYAEVEEAGNGSGSALVSFTAFREGGYTVRAETETGSACRVEQELHVLPMSRPRIEGQIIIGGDIVCRSGKTNTASIPAQPWAESYRWEVTDGEGIELGSSNGRTCTIIANNSGNSGNFSLKVTAYDGYCYEDNQILRRIPVNDIRATAAYIDPATQGTYPLAICRNSTAVPIRGPQSSSPNADEQITSWFWDYNHSTSRDLPIEFSEDQPLSVTVTDRRGCQRTYSFTAEVQQPPSASLPPVHACQGEDVTLDLSGIEAFEGIEDGRFTWESGHTGRTLTLANPHMSMNKTLTISYGGTEEGSCTANYTQHIEYHPLPQFEDNPPPACHGDAVTVTAPLDDTYEYSWHNMTDGNDSDNPYYTVEEITGTNELLLTAEAEGCTFTREYTLTALEEAELILEMGNSQSVCHGSDIALGVPDGFTDILWGNTGETAQNITIRNITETQEFTVSAEKGGCTAEAAVTITPTPLADIYIETDRESYCEGEATLYTLTGEIGGEEIAAADFDRVNWSHGINQRFTNTFYFSENTEISCEVTDRHGCISTAYKTVRVNPAPELEVLDMAVCEGEGISVTAPAGFESYEWFSGETSPVLELDNVTSNVNGFLRATDYSGCTGTDEFTVSVINTENIYVEPASICEGESAVLRAPGGFTSYMWNTGETSSMIEVSPEDDFTYTCTADNGECETVIEYLVEVNRPEPFTLENITACKGANTQIEGPDGYDRYIWNLGGAETKDLIFRASTNFIISCTAWKNGCPHTASALVATEEAEKFSFSDKAICEGSSATYTAPAGYEYDWSDDEFDGLQTASFSPSENADYSLTIINGNGCTYTEEFKVNVNSFIQFDVPDREICRGNSTSISVPAIYATYLWDNGGTGSSIEVQPLSDADYTVTVTDLNGCTGTATSQVTVLDALIVSLEDTEICRGEYATLGLEDDRYSSYSWNTGSRSRQITVSPNATSEFVLTVEDDYGCSATASMNLTVHEPEEISISPATICQGQEAQLIAPTGLTGHTWNGSETNTDNYSFSPKFNSIVNYAGTDANGCRVHATGNVRVNMNPVLNINDKHLCKFKEMQMYIPSNFASYAWSTGSTTPMATLQALESETVSVTVTDQNGCSSSDEFNVEIYDYQPITFENQTVCLGEPATLTLEGDWASVIWNNGKHSSQITEYLQHPADFSVTATDLNGCQSTGYVSVNVIEPRTSELMEISFCQGDTATVTADPGFESYLWHTGETTQSIDISPDENTVITLSLTDRNGCTSDTRTIATVFRKPEIFLSDQLACQGESVELVAPGGFRTYQWNNGAEGRRNSVTAQGTRSYTVTAEDENGCTASATAAVEAVSDPEIELENIHVCPGTTVTLDAGPGHSYYAWSNGVTGRYCTVDADESIQLTATVRNAQGCQSQSTVSVIAYEPEPLELSDIRTCRGDTVTLSAGRGFASYEWSTGDSTASIRAVLSKYETVSVTAIDANGCRRHAEARITALDKPDFDLFPEYTACRGGSVTVSVIPGYQFYRWADGGHGSERTFSPSHNETHTLEVEHINGCRAEKSTEIKVTDLTDIYLDDVLACRGEYITFEIENENIAAIEWSTGESGRSAITVKADTDTAVSAEFTDYHGCTGSAGAFVMLRPSRQLGLEDISLCRGESRRVTPSGVFESYRWSTGETAPTIEVQGDHSREISLEVSDASSGCTHNESFSVTVHENPRVSLSDMTICSDDTVAIGISQEENVSYLWSTGDTTSIIYRSVSEDAAYTLNAENRESGCSSSAEMSLTVHEKPEFDIPDQFSQPSAEMILSVPETMRSVQWSTGEREHTIVVQPDTNTYYYVSAVDHNGCSVSDNIFVYVMPDDAEMVRGDTVCEGQSAQLMARPGYQEYRWSTGETSYMIEASPDATEDYTVEIIDHKGELKSFRATAYVNPKPAVPVGDTSICMGDDLTVRLSEGLADYSWSFGAQEPQYTFQNINAGFSYSVRAVDSKGCENEQQATVQLHQQPFDIRGVKDTVDAGEIMRISLTNPELIEYIEWEIGGTPYNSTAISASIAEPGTHTVQVSAEDIHGCSFESSQAVTVNPVHETTGIENGLAFSVYPIPAESAVTIETQGMKHIYEITDISGKVLIKGEGSGKSTADISNLAKGAYIISITAGSKKEMREIIKK